MIHSMNLKDATRGILILIFVVILWDVKSKKIAIFTNWEAVSRRKIAKKENCEKCRVAFFRNHPKDIPCQLLGHLDYFWETRSKISF